MWVVLYFSIKPDIVSADKKQKPPHGKNHSTGFVMASIKIFVDRGACQGEICLPVKNHGQLRPFHKKSSNGIKLTVIFALHNYKYKKISVNTIVRE